MTVGRWCLLASMLLWGGGCGPSCQGPATTLLPRGAGDSEPPQVGARCELALEEYVEGTGTGARAVQISEPGQLIGGPNAQGQVGDYLLENDRVRAIIQGPGRHIGPQPYGGTLLDADVRRDGPGQDQLGELGLLYNFGRTVDPSLFEVISDGSGGGPAVLAASGLDAPNDYLNIRSQLVASLGSSPVVDPYVEVPLKVTNYFILAPGAAHVRLVTAFCNLSQAPLTLAVGDLGDPGGQLELFNGESCTGGLGSGGPCFGLDLMRWYGYLGPRVAYGYAPHAVNGGTRPETGNALITVAGVTGTLIGAPGLQGLLSWLNRSREHRPGELRLPPNGVGSISRDFFIGKDLGEVTSMVERDRAVRSGAFVGEVSGTVTSGGAPLAGARVAYREASTHVALFTTDDTGSYAGALHAGTYQVTAWAPAHLPSPPQTSRVSKAEAVPSRFSLTAPRQLTVNVREVGGGPMPARVTVLCASGVCPAPASSLLSFTDALQDPQLNSIARVEFVPASGTVTFALPPANYLVVVSRGPEYSLYPNSYPASAGEPVDLTHADKVVNAALARVIDTTGYVSADFHVHAVNSPDSTVDNPTRALGFAADGLDVLVSSDHDYVTDFGPVIAQAGLSSFLATVVGEEVSSMDFGHYNLFPVEVRSDDPITFGALDWAGGRGPTLSPALIFEAGRRRGATTVQFNHPRGSLGGLTYLKADLDTLATHADPAQLRMQPVEGATADDTQLLSTNFNAYEVLNPGVDEFEPTLMRPMFNDWFTLLSRGLRVAGTGVSDTHHRSLSSGWRTFVRTGRDDAASFEPIELSTALNEMRATVTNGPFAVLSAYRVDEAGTQVTPSVQMGGVVDATPGALGVTVDVQVPEYLDITRVELYLHRPEDDASCPLDRDGPNAATTRVACGGESNQTWPESGVAARQEVSLTAADLEVVTQEEGVTYRRYRKQVSFRLPRPATDNWVVAFVYGSRSLFPLLYRKQSAEASSRPVLPFAFTNPVFVDADGNGFDHPPFHPPPQRRGLRPHREAESTEALPLEERLRRWGSFAGAQ